MAKGILPKTPPTIARGAALSRAIGTPLAASISIREKVPASELCHMPTFLNCVCLMCRRRILTW